MLAKYQTKRASPSRLVDYPITVILFNLSYFVEQVNKAQTLVGYFAHIAVNCKKPISGIAI